MEVKIFVVPNFVAVTKPFFFLFVKLVQTTNTITKYTTKFNDNNTSKTMELKQIFSVSADGLNDPTPVIISRGMFMSSCLRECLCSCPWESCTEKPNGAAGLGRPCSTLAAITKGPVTGWWPAGGRSVGGHLWWLIGHRPIGQRWWPLRPPILSCHPVATQWTCLRHPGQADTNTDADTNID